MKKFLVFVAENITVILTIILGGIVFFTYKNYSEEQLLNYVISILTLIAASMLIEKLVKLDSIEKRVKKIEKAISQSHTFIHCNSTNFWRDAKEKGKHFFLSGGSLYHVLSEKSGDFESLLDSGCTFSVVIVRPYSDVSKQLFQSTIKEITLSSFNLNIVSTLSFLLPYIIKYPNQITVRINDVVPAFGIFAIYQGKTPTSIQVNLFSGKVSYDKRLSFVLNEFNTIEFDYFCNQIIDIETSIPVVTAGEIELLLHKYELIHR